MTIDNAITWLNTDDFESKGFANATSIAIDTMRKYQKIQEIIANNDNDGMIGRLVRELIEDGNDN